jgi:uncharacterized protein YbjT (DUF2867 family)
MSQQKSWDLGRFVRTLTYFDAIPLISNISWLREMILGDNPEQVNQAVSPRTGVVLVAGATGGVGKRVVQQLREGNYPVRALVRSIERAKPILGDEVEFYEGDLTIPDSLKPELMADVVAVICCTGTRVQPVEGDTPDRQKYYQGVKFYQPEIAESTPEAVEYKGITNLVQLAAQHLEDSSLMTLFDFTSPSEEIKSIWGAIDDVVMGGVSESGIRLAGNTAVFSGNVSTENNGGFASIRTRNFDPPWDLSGYEGILLRVKGDGKRYKFLLRDETKWDGVGYSYSFDTVKDRWIDVRVPFAELIPVFRAKTVNEEGSFNASKTYAMQLMQSKFEYDKELNPTFEEGAFDLQVASIQAYGKRTPQFVMVSAAGVTRPGRSGLNLEQEPPAVKMNDQLGGILTWKLQGEESVRESGLNYAIVRPCALTEQPGDKALYVEQGDNLKGQVSREAIATLCIQVIEQPQACDKTLEVREEAQGSNDWESLFSKLQPDQ